ncbi:unnamed protein product [Amoebophrya sp. A25]|nr:unnamed protein product [Amoebophrya sp. A25]|eukprot:GSA25T00023901001.1
MGQKLLKCKQADNHSAFVATMDRLSEPTGNMVTALRALEENQEALTLLLQRLLAEEPRRGEGVSMSPQEGNERISSQSGVGHDAGGGSATAPPNPAHTSITSETSNRSSNRICYTNAEIVGDALRVVLWTLPGVFSWTARETLEFFAGKTPQERVDLLLRQRLVACTGAAQVCRSRVLPRLRELQYIPGIICAPLRDYLVAAVECILIYDKLEFQLTTLGEGERQMVYGTAVSDQLALWTVTN